MSLMMTKIVHCGRSARALGLAVALGSALVAGCTPSPLKPGPIAGKTVYLDDARNYPYCEFEVITSVVPHVTVQVYNTSGQERCLPGTIEKIDAESLAKKVSADKIVKNPTRFWLVDQLWSYDAGETFNFDGIEATWMAKIELPLTDALHKEKDKPFPPYTEAHPSRHSKYAWKKGSEVYLLRDPNGKVWIMQAYTNLVDKSLTIEGLRELGGKLKLPPGWTYEVKTLDRELTYEPVAPGYTAYFIADDLQNAYQGCGFDTSCNYIP
jgi:hypothetical protein